MADLALRAFHLRCLWITVPFGFFVNHLKAGSLLFFSFSFMNLTKCCVILVFFIHQKP